MDDIYEILKRKHTNGKFNTRTVHQIAICHTCGAEWQDYINHRARKAAYNHAKKTGHKVSVETGIITTYN